MTEPQKEKTAPRSVWGILIDCGPENISVGVRPESALRLKIAAALFGVIFVGTMAVSGWLSWLSLAKTAAHGALETADRRELFCPDTPGTVGRIIVDPGAAVASGQPLAEINGGAAGPRTVAAPFPAVVDEILLSKGQPVSAGQRAFVLLAAERMVFSCRVPETVIGNVSLGKPGIINLTALPDLPVPGIVESVSGRGTVSEAGGEAFFQVKLRLETGDSRLRLGMTGTVSF